VVTCHEAPSSADKDEDAAKAPDDEQDENDDDDAQANGDGDDGDDGVDDEAAEDKQEVRPSSWGKIASIFG
jgi:hypothetical protein